MFELTIEPSGDVLEVEEGQTILDAILRNGLHIPYQCGHGLCSTCKVTILEGDVDDEGASPFALLDFERQEGVTLACCARACSDLVIEADIEQDPDARRIPVQDFNGVVERMEMLTPDIRGIWLRLDQPLDFQAGQYINLHVPGVDGPRAFSIASPQSSSTLIELNVRLVPQGQATTYLHHNLELGHTLRLSGPFGRFFVRRSRNSPILLVGGGSGLSSPKSMLLDLLEETSETPIWLFHGARTRRDLYYAELFEKLATEHRRFRYTPVLSQADDDASWEGERGFVHQALERAFPDGFRGWNAYLCGPPPMIEATIRSLMQGRLFENDIFTERFLTQADAEAATRTSKIFRKL